VAERGEEPCPVIAGARLRLAGTDDADIEIPLMPEPLGQSR
jgi:hypothetical protein